VTKLTSLALSLVVLTAASLPAAAFNDYIGRKRPMIVFAPNADHPGYVLQRNVINGNRIGFSDRDLVVIYVVGGEVKTEFGAGPGMNAAAIRQRFRISEGQFRTFLVDKDGKLKLDSPTALSRNDIIGELDRAPLTRDQRKRSGQPIGQ
jgi:Domain of unknown function (DUF4174)